MSQADGLVFRGVVAFARQNFQVFAADVYFNFAEFAVPRRISRIVAQGVLAAQFFGYLVECFLKMFLVVDDNHAAAGFVGDFLGDAGVGAKMRIVDEKNVHDRVRTLGGFDGFFHSDFAAIVFGVCQHNDSFAAGLGRQLFIAGQIESVVEIRALGSRLRDRSRRDGSSPATGVDLRFANGAIQARNGCR